MSISMLHGLSCLFLTLFPLSESHLWAPTELLISSGWFPYNINKHCAVVNTVVSDLSSWWNASEVLTPFAHARKYNSTVFNFIMTISSTFVSVKYSINCNMNIGLLIREKSPASGWHAFKKIILLDIPLNNCLSLVLLWYLLAHSSKLLKASTYVIFL